MKKYVEQFFFMIAILFVGNRIFNHVNAWLGIAICFGVCYPKDLWAGFHSAGHDYENHWGGYSYKDKNILETIIRRYKCTWS